VRNLEEKVKMEELKSSLTEIFSEYGNIIDLVAKTNLKAKGQAFIVFEDVSAAARAIDEVNGFELFDKPMQLDFARTRSDATVLREEGESGLERWKRGRLAEKERKQALEATQQKLKRPAAANTADVLAARPAKTSRGAGLKASGTNASAVIPDEYLPPNKILFLRDLPESYDAEGLSRIFSRFEGFREVRMVPGRKGIAFVEYEAEAGAISAKEATAGMQLGDEGKGLLHRNSYYLPSKVNAYQKMTSSSSFSPSTSGAWTSFSLSLSPISLCLARAAFSSASWAA
jgi:RNA recognition motif-containing protein